SLDFNQGDTVDQIIIGLRGTRNFTATRPRSNTVIIDVPGAFVPQSLTRTLDTSRFVSPVESVRAYRSSMGARINITLRADASYSTRMDGDLLVVDVPVPESVRRERIFASAQAPATVSPGGSQGRLENSYRQEILIGSSGRTADPNATFSPGYGTRNYGVLGANGFMYDTGSATDVPYTGREVNINVVNADIHSIFRLISSVSRLNIVAGDNVQGTVTVQFERVPWDQAFAAILQSQGLASQRIGNVVRVAPLETIQRELEQAAAAKISNNELTDPQLLVIPLNYATASEVRPQLEAMLSDRGSLQIDERGNQLIIKDVESILAQIRELVRQLDKITPQVLIEARVVEATTTFSKGLGVQWGMQLDASSATGFPTGLFFPNAVGASGGISPVDQSAIFFERGQDNLLVDLGTAANSAVSFSFGSIPGVLDLDARLSALESDGYGKVISSPKVIIMDNKEATVLQGARIPYLAVSQQGANVQFAEAALTLVVTPHITSDDKVFLTVEITNNRADFSQVVQGQPSIQTKEVSTEVLISDGDTTVLGGVYSTEENYNQGRVPGLSKIPLLGYLFKNSSETVSRNELLVFITPHIIRRTTLEQ
ncbi:MAG: type IV pilus secretin PilQ, partial [Myxococcota bacterium]